MSQEKVDRYKEKKARRHEIYKKEKRMLALEKRSEERRVGKECRL